MKISKIYIKPDSTFSAYVRNWANASGIQTEDYDIRMPEHIADGFLLITANQDVEREFDELHTLFDSKHIPTQKVDINGTLQVAVSSFKLWLKNNKCRNILILGSNELTKNENLERFFRRVEETIAESL